MTGFAAKRKMEMEARARHVERALARMEQSARWLSRPRLEDPHRMAGKSFAAAVRGLCPDWTGFARASRDKTFGGLYSLAPCSWTNRRMGQAKRSIALMQIRPLAVFRLILICSLS
ncbi:MAG: hypothetical protein ACREDH_00265 [Methylocella sp.]